MKRNLQFLGGAVPRKIVSRKMLTVAGAIILLFCLGGGVLWYQNRPKPKEGLTTIAPNNGFEKTIQALQSQPLPTKPADQVIYYSELAQSHEALEQYTKSIEYYLKGQEVIDRNNLNAEMSFYTSLSNIYYRTGDKRKGDDYRQKSNDRNRQFQHTTSGIQDRIEVDMK